MILMCHFITYSIVSYYYAEIIETIMLAYEIFCFLPFQLCDARKPGLLSVVDYLLIETVFLN